MRRYAEEREEKNAGENVRSHYTLVSLLLSIGVLSGCQGRTVGQDVDLSCALVASDRAGMVSCATSIVEQLSVEQKVAQMIQGEIRGLSADDVKKYGLGSVLNGGGGSPGGDKYATPQDWVDLADAYFSASIDASEGSAGIPIVWGTDAVHGHNNVMGATLFPHNIGLGATRDPELVARIIGATAREVKATGIDWIFAPTVAVAKDARWGRTYE